jgi:hypothetical protein
MTDLLNFCKEKTSPELQKTVYARKISIYSLELFWATGNPLA